jgi:hypothetical protein
MRVKNRTKYATRKTRINRIVLPTVSSASFRHSDEKMNFRNNQLLRGELFQKRLGDPMDANVSGCRSRRRRKSHATSTNQMATIAIKTEKQIAIAGDMIRPHSTHDVTTDPNKQSFNQPTTRFAEPVLVGGGSQA